VTSSTTERATVISLWGKWAYTCRPNSGAILLQHTVCNFVNIDQIYTKFGINQIISL